MTAGPGDDLRRSMPINQGLGNNKTGTKRARNGLGWNAHAIINPFSIQQKVERPEGPSARRAITATTCHFVRHRDVGRGCVNYDSSDFNVPWQYVF